MFYHPLFDLNRNGRIDAAEWAFMNSVINSKCDEVSEEEEIGDERREALEDADLDPDDYDEF